MTSEEANQQELEHQEHDLMKGRSLLNMIQCQLNAPKNQFNSFGKYHYRSCEDILEGLKPLLRESNACVMLNDDIITVGDRVYVKATATLLKEGQTIAETSAFAREPHSKKGMDDSQVTGTASSYARKYALNGLFLIDDAKDADTDEAKNQEKSNNGQPKQPRVPHEDHLLTCKTSMDEAPDIETLKIIARSSYDYFKSWNQPEFANQVNRHYAVIEESLKKSVNA